MAMDVPASDDTLPVPSSVGIDVPGRKMSRAGNWIKPPPPTMESINPARKAKKQR
jgi:hypothetical protein